MNRSFLLLSAAIASLAFACSTPAEDASSSDDALTGSLASAKACAVRDAYGAAQLSAFKSAAKTELSGVQQTATSSLSKFDVKDVGNVFVSEDGNAMSFYDVNGTLLARATSNGAGLDWAQANNAPLSCEAQEEPAPVVDPDPKPAATTCLSTDPIDATQYAYNPPAPAAAGKCTAQEVSTLGAYYAQHSADENVLDGWKASVSSACSSCAFGDVNAANWATILITDGVQFDVNRGGCIGTVSHSEECGRAYQQYEDCTLDACLVKCQTQDEFTACRQDATVLTTACQGAITNVTSACGQDKIAEYESSCKGTTYTFEGPLNVACVTGQ